ncbi:MAG: dockerin type I domain-containing protein, partial [Clostridiales bacterium]|nr:dockerin type I domain-containing protein [Clostridiales bacterium]
HTDADMQALADELGSYFQNTIGAILGAGSIDTKEIIQGFLTIIEAYIMIDDLSLLNDILEDFVAGLAKIDFEYKIDMNMIIARTLTYLSATAMRFYDSSNPHGFDLYVTKDGKNFQPVTVDGFGDPHNYGGRIIIPSRHGLFVGTANPFTGAQMWRIDHQAFGIFPNGPANITLENNKSAYMTVLLRDGEAGSQLVLDYESELVEVNLVKREVTKNMLASNWENQIKADPVTYLKYYAVTEHSHNYSTQMYDVIITAKALGEQELVLGFTLNGERVSKTIALNIIESNSIEVFGKVYYQPSSRPASITLCDSKGHSVYTTKTTNDGFFTLFAPITSAGEKYTLTIAKPGYLSYTIENIPLADGMDIGIIDLSPLAGDIDGDGFVNAEDLTYLLSDFNKAQAKPEYCTDIDGNGIVNAVDLTYLLAGFNKQSVVVLWPETTN